MKLTRLTPLLLLLLAAAPAVSVEQDLDAALDAAARSGGVELIGVTSSERLEPAGRLAPGDAPILQFRYLDGQRRHRYGDLNLMMDDAGH